MVDKDSLFTPTFHVLNLAPAQNPLYNNYH